MKDLHRGVCGIDPLSAGSSGAADLNAQIFHLEFEIDFLRFGQNSNSRRGRMDAPLGFGGGDALNTMDAGFVAHPAEDRISREPEDNFLQPAEIGLAGVQRLNLPAMSFRKSAIHAVQVGCEKRGFRSAGSGANLHDRVAIFAGFRRKKGNLEVPFELGQASFEVWQFGYGELGHLSVVRPPRAFGSPQVPSRSSRSPSKEP